jgi:hypothetical protein
LTIVANAESPPPPPIRGPQHFWGPSENVCQLQRDCLMLYASFVCHVLLQTDYDIQFFTVSPILLGFIKTCELEYEDIFS